MLLLITKTRIRGLDAFRCIGAARRWGGGSARVEGREEGGGRKEWWVGPTRQWPKNAGVGGEKKYSSVI